MKLVSYRMGPATLAIILIFALLIAACGSTGPSVKTAVPATATKAAAAATTVATKAPAGSATAVATTAATKAPAAAGTAVVTKAPTGAAATVAPTKAPAGSPSAATTKAPTASAATVSFGKDVLPILQKNCVRCHGGNAPRSGLSLETYHNAIKGGNNAPDVVAGKPDRSVLCTYPRDGIMPPSGAKLAAADAQKICDWIAQGALDN